MCPLISSPYTTLFRSMLGRVPIGNLIHPALPAAADWLMEVPQNAAKRGILMGAALGVMATGFRIILGDRKSTRLNSSHRCISYDVFCLNKIIHSSHSD